jgi:glycosyltransferase involved in cell wall biosynthesis
VIRVLYVSPVGHRGGAEAVLLNLVRHHDRVRVQPAVCFLKEGPLVREVADAGVPVFRVKTTRVRDLVGTARAVAAIRGILRDQRIDIVCGNGGVGHVHAALAAWRTGIRRVWFEHNVPDSRHPLTRLALWLGADRAYVGSEAARRVCLARGIAARQVQVVRYGVEDGTASPAASPQFRRGLGIPEDAPLVAMIARFQRWKGQHVMVEAASRIVRARPDARVVLVGDTMFGIEPDYRGEIEALVERLGLREHVLFAGFRDDLADVLPEIDVLAHPLLAPEPFPGLVVMDALQHGRAVVTTAPGAGSDVLVDGQNALLVPPGDAAALADRILTLLADASLRRRLGERGRAAVRDGYSIGQMVETIERSYDTLLALRAAAGGVDAVSPT